MKKFIEKNSKWIVRILVILGLFFIVKLWLIGLHITSAGGGGFIDISIGWNFEYFWMNAGYIALALLFVSILLLFAISNVKNKATKILLAFIILLLGISGKQIFFLVSPDFKFYLTPVTRQYKDNKGNITDIDKYLDLVGRYCDNGKDDFDYMYSRETMCSGKFETDFKTVDEYIKILEFAKNNDFRYLYQSTFRWVDDNVGLENLIEKYDEDTFYAYVIYKRGLEDSTIQKLKQKISNINVLDLLEFYNSSIIENQNLNNLDKGHNRVLFWERFDKEIKLKIKEIPNINYNIF